VVPELHDDTLTELFLNHANDLTHHLQLLFHYISSHHSRGR